MYTLGRTLLILGFVITAAALLWLIFGSIEFPRGETIGDLEYHATAAHRYIPYLALVVLAGAAGLTAWRARHR